MPNPTTFDPIVILDRLSYDRLRSYLDDCGNDLNRALDLYDWNAHIAAAFLEDLGRLEVVLRNRFDEALTELTASAGRPPLWYDHKSLFPGKHARNALRDLRKAKQRATDHGKRAMIHNKVISELNFGFWRFLCSPRYHTTMWVPALAAQFPNHPSIENAAQIRTEVESRMRQLHFLRNRVAHHKPIHRRALTDDAALIFALAQWMCLDPPEFWAIVARLMPAYETHKTVLATFGKNIWLGSVTEK
jgi:hypothetical protein